MLLVAIECIEVLVFLTAELLTVIGFLTLGSKLGISRRVTEGMPGPSTSRAYSIKAMLTATTFAAIFVAATRSLINDSFELWRISFVCGVLTGLVFAVGEMSAGRRPRFSIRLLISLAIVALTSWGMSSTSGFLDEATQLVNSVRWNFDPSEKSLLHTCIFLIGVWVVSALTARGKIYRHKPMSIQGSLLWLVALLTVIPVLVLAIWMPLSSGRSISFGAEYDFELLDDFRRELQDNTFSTSLTTLDRNRAEKLGDKIVVEAASPKYHFDLNGNPQAWQFVTKQKFEFLKHFAAARRQNRGNMRYEFLRVASKWRDDPGYQDIREIELAELKREFGWRGRLYELLILSTGDRVPDEFVNFDLYVRSLLSMLEIDYHIREELRRPNADFESIAAAELRRFVDPFSRRGEPVRLIRKGDSDFTLYSVGFDGLDDGGKPLKSNFGRGDIVLPIESEYVIAQ